MNTLSNWLMLWGGQYKPETHLSHTDPVDEPKLENMMARDMKIGK